MNVCKSTGPDGFNAEFYKMFWDLIKEDVCIMFNQFFKNEVLPKRPASFFVALIPKVENSLEFGEFKPISLLGSLYKLVTQVMEVRLAKVIGKLIALE